MKDDADRLLDGTLPVDPFAGAMLVTPQGYPILGTEESYLEDLDETLLSLKHRDIKKTPSLIGDGVLKEGRVGILYGVGGCSKSWLVFRLAIAVARGEPWCGLPTTQGRVGIVSFEMFDEDIQERLFAIDPDREAGLENIHILSRDKLPPLKLPDAGKRILRWANKRQLDLIIIDPLADTLAGPETNETLAPIIDELKHISLESGAAVLLVHHSRKGDRGKPDDPLDALRGASQLRDRVDLLIYIERKKPGDLRRLTFTKVRSAKEPEPIWLDAKGAVTDSPEGAATTAEANRAEVRRLFEDHPEVAYTADQVLNEIKLTKANGNLIKADTVRTRYLAPLVRELVLEEVPISNGIKAPKRWRWRSSNVPTQGFQS